MVGAVVVIVSVAGVPGAIELGLIEQCGASVDAGESEQARETDPLNPFTAFTFTVEVDDCPGDTGLGVAEEPESVNVGKSATILSSTLAEKKFGAAMSGCPSPLKSAIARP